MIGTYYYPWYGKPVSPILGMGDWKSGYTNTPILGEYNSRDSKVINQHLNWAKEGGIDFFAINWLGPQTWEDITLKDYYLPLLESAQFKFCIHYDSSFAVNKFRLGSSKPQPSFNFASPYATFKTKGEKFVEDFEYLADNYFHHPKYLKINNQPVVLIYNLSAFKNATEYLEQLKNKMAKRETSLFLIGDVVIWGGVRLSKRSFSFLWKEAPPQETMQVFWQALRRLSPKNLEKETSLTKYFQGITSYNLYGENRTSNFLESVNKLYQKFWKYANSQQLYFIPSISPGHDDRNLKGSERPIIERKEGEIYQGLWEIAQNYIDPKLKMFLVATFNEWHEGTEIEPSKEYGKQYLQLTKSFADQL